MLGLLLLAATLASGGSQGVNLTIEGDVTQVDPARSLFLTVTLTSPKERQVALPDLRDRVVGSRSPKISMKSRLRIRKAVLSSGQIGDSYPRRVRRFIN